MYETCESLIYEWDDTHEISIYKTQQQTRKEKKKNEYETVYLISIGLRFPFNPLVLDADVSFIRKCKNRYLCVLKMVKMDFLRFDSTANDCFSLLLSYTLFAMCGVHRLRCECVSVYKDFLIQMYGIRIHNHYILNSCYSLEMLSLMYFQCCCSLELQRKRIDTKWATKWNGEAKRKRDWNRLCFSFIFKFRFHVQPKQQQQLATKAINLLLHFSSFI